MFLKNRRPRFDLPLFGSLTLGRSSECDVQVDDPSVSRCHLTLHCDGARLCVEDHGSRNGTRIFPSSPSPDGSEEDTHHSTRDWHIEPRQLVEVHPGDMIRVGGVLVRVDAAPAEASPKSALTTSAVVVDERARKVYALAARIAASNISALILGETGVGKDVLALAIHKASGRADKPFVRIHCAALPESLMESELFGHVRGAFTGANAQKTGLIESANGGTVFLDELGELPLTTQVKLLNVLETGEVQKVGATRPTKVDVRFIAATNRDLPQEIQAGRFRRDLFFRINAVSLLLPPLRERPADIEPLARHFLRRFCESSNLEVPELSRELLMHMQAYTWPGNVRELKNTMERAPLLATDGSPLTPAHLSLDELPPDSSSDFLDDNTDVFTPESAPAGPEATKKDRSRVIEALEACGGNQTRAARVLGISRRTLIVWLDALHLPRPRKSSPG
jgi:transcriptional regulator with PAS, ATPase and Fis domain